MKRCYFSVDVETSSGGKLWPPESNLLSIGACVIGEHDSEYSFYRELKPTNGQWSLDAEKIHGLSRAKLLESGSEPLHAMRDFRDWVLRIANDRMPVFCAQPVNFDWRYVGNYFSHFLITNPFLETLDGRKLYRSIKNIPPQVKVPREQIWKDFPTALPHTHNALDDAREQGEVFEKMLRFSGQL